MNLTEFDAAWRAFVVQWGAARRDRKAGLALLDRALIEGLAPAVDTDAQPNPSVALLCEVALVKRAGALDVAAYRRTHGSTRKIVRAPERHFCEFGWRQLQNPRLDFDTWWYWNEHLDPGDDRINPLVHHVLVGRRAGLTTVPEPAERTDSAPAPGHRPRRVSLFAGYDADGIVDDHVVAFVSELARHGDVYYLADATLAPGELDKLSAVTTGAWSVRHGRGHAGSWSLLATNLVGWEALATYDEVIFADDDAYLLRPLDEVFEQTASATCDWWGLQAVKRTWSRDNGDTARVPIGQALDRWATVPEMDPRDYLHSGSHLVGYRRSVVTDPDFRHRIAGLARKRRPTLPRTFDAVMSHHLLSRGFSLTTFLGDVVPDDPTYSADVWSRIEAGHPLLSRDLLATNPARVPDLGAWKSKLAHVAPEADTDVIERHLVRVSPDDDLNRSFSVSARPDGTVDYHSPLSWDRLRREDEWAPTFDHWWAFPVCAYDHTLAGNERAVFEQVRDDPSIKKIILTRSRRVDLSGENVEVVPLLSRPGQEYLLRAGQIFVKHSPRANAHWPLSPLKHNFINLWHGIPLKRFGSASATISPQLERAMRRGNGACRAVIASSRMDALAMTNASWPLSYPEVWVTGLPRNDFITCPKEQLPGDLLADEERLREELAGRRLVMFLPTFKDGQADAYYQFSAEESERIRRWMKRHNAVLGVREHMADKARTYWHQLSPLGSVDLSSRRFSNLEVLYRVADGLISDYSSCLVDFMLTGRPVASFAYDFDHYSSRERGLFYDLEKVLPGPVCRTFDQLEHALDGFFDSAGPRAREDYQWRRRIFFDHVDHGAAERVVDRVKSLYL